MFFSIFILLCFCSVMLSNLFTSKSSFTFKKLTLISLIFFTGISLSTYSANQPIKEEKKGFFGTIKEIDEKIDLILESAGIKYTDKFYSAEGDSALGENPSDDELGKYAAYLKKAGKYRKEISKTKYNIEFCETMQKIRAEENQIQNLNRTIKNCENAIKEAEKKIGNSETAIKNSEAKIADLKDLAAELEEKFADKTSEQILEEE